MLALGSVQSRRASSGRRGNRGTRLTLLSYQVAKTRRMCGAAAKCSNQTDLRPALTDPIRHSDLPQRPSSTCMRLVCIQKARGSSPLSSTPGQRPNAILKASKQSQTKSQSRRTIRHMTATTRCPVSSNLSQTS